MAACCLPFTKCSFFVYKMPYHLAFPSVTMNMESYAQLTVHLRRRLYAVLFETKGVYHMSIHSETQHLTENPNRIDVTEDFIYNSRNPKYNAASRIWRKQTDSPYLYRLVVDSREHAYTEGTGFSNVEPALHEQKVLHRVSEVIGFALLFFLVVQLGAGSLIVSVLHLLGMDIRLDFLTFSMSGSQWLVIAVRIFVMLLQYGGALLIANRYFRVPVNVQVPVTANAFPEATGAVGWAMLSAAVFCILDRINGDGAEAAQHLFSYKNSAALGVYGFFEILVLPLLHELLMRSTLLPVLRQFGDGFAVCAVAGMALLFPNAVPARVGMCLIGFGAGYFLLKGGSFLNCVLMHIIYHALMDARLVLAYHDGAVITPLQYALLLGSVGVAAIFTYSITRRGQLRLENTTTLLPNCKKISLLGGSVTMLPWIAFSMLTAVVQLLL